MGRTCVVGLQWGDEAKGKVVDLLTGDHDVVVRFNGGANAGHTVRVGEKTYKLSLVPSGIVHEGIRCVIGNGVVVDPPKLLAEIDTLVDQGVQIQDRLFLSDRAHVILPYHMEAERLVEEAAGSGAIGTTRRGIGPCYADKAGRLFSVRVHELLDPKLLREKLAAVVPHKNAVLRALGEDAAQYEVETLAAEFDAYADRLRPLVADTFWLLQRDLAAGRDMLFEAAQGSLLDLDHGSYPFVTSSSSSVCGLPAGCGVAARNLDRVIGIVKAYTTRVGGGPMPTELTGDIGDRIRTAGNEFGTVTGRPRRCGWLDLVATRYSAILNGVDEIALMLLDVLSKMGEVRVCGEYEMAGERTREFPPTAAAMAQAKPVYRTLPGWQRDITGCRTPADLPSEARQYIDVVAEAVGVPVRIVSVGPKRSETILLD